MSSIYIAFLGTPQILRDQQPIELNIAKLQALLCYLTVTRSPHAREQLLALLWAESHPDAARKNLRNRLWQLRQLLGEEVLRVDGDRLALAPTVQSDVTAFEEGIRQQLQRATIDPVVLHSLLDLWRGPLLDGVHLSEAPDFELWLASEREHLAQIYKSGLDALIHYYSVTEEWKQVVTFSQQGLQHDPLHEPFHQQLMHAYAQQGLRSEALRQYDHLHALLAQELGVEPLPETVALRTKILSAETLISPHLPVRNAALHSQLPDKSPIRNSYSALTSAKVPFVGRQKELALLDSALKLAETGQCAVLLMSGEMGIGKSRLLQTWASRLPAQQVVLETRCLNTTQTVPFDPLRRWLNSPISRTHFATIGDKLLPVWRAELLHLAPGLQPETINPATILLPPSEERAQVAEALTQYLRSFPAPQILFVDDLHWADEATLNWLLYLTDRMAKEPLLLVAAYRPEDASPSLNRIVAQWQRDGVLQRVPLPKFSAQETASLLAALESNTAMADYLHSQSGGNPYYLTQLSDVAVDGVPATLAELIQARVGYLPETVQPILQAAALLEPIIDLQTIRHTSQRSEEDALDALDILLTHGVLIERSEHYEFAHPLVATVVREGLSSARRKLYHRRAAEGIQAHYTQQLSVVAGQLARHYGEAGEVKEAARFAELAGEQALRIGASEEAVRFFQQAQELEPAPARQLGIGMALMYLPGKLAEARLAMQQALEQFEAQSDCGGIVKAGLRLAASYIGTQEGEQVLHWTRRVLPDLESVDDPELQASAHYLMGTAKFRNGYSMVEAQEHYIAATRLASEHKFESEIAVMSWFEWGNLCLHLGEYAMAVEKFQRTRDSAQAARSVLFEALSLNNLAYAYLLMGKLEVAQKTIDAGLAHAETYALLAPRQYLFSTSGEIALAAGKLDAAEERFQQALQLAEKYANLAFIANLQAHLGRVAMANGRFDNALAQLTTAQSALNGDASRHLKLQIMLWLTELHLKRGDPVAAEQALNEAETSLALGQYHMLTKAAERIRAKIENRFDVNMREVK